MLPPSNRPVGGQSSICLSWGHESEIYRPTHSESEWSNSASGYGNRRPDRIPVPGGPLDGYSKASGTYQGDYDGQSPSRHDYEDEMSMTSSEYYANRDGQTPSKRSCRLQASVASSGYRSARGGRTPLGCSSRSGSEGSYGGYRSTRKGGTPGGHNSQAFTEGSYEASRAARRGRAPRSFDSQTESEGSYRSTRDGRTPAARSASSQRSASSVEFTPKSGRLRDACSDGDSACTPSEFRVRPGCTMSEASGSNTPSNKQKMNTRIWDASTAASSRTSDEDSRVGGRFQPPSRISQRSSTAPRMRPIPEDSITSNTSPKVRSSSKHTHQRSSYCGSPTSSQASGWSAATLSNISDARTADSLPAGADASMYWSL